MHELFLEPDWEIGMLPRIIQKGSIILGSRSYLGFFKYHIFDKLPVIFFLTIPKAWTSKRSPKFSKLSIQIVMIIKRAKFIKLVKNEKFNMILIFFLSFWTDEIQTILVYINPLNLHIKCQIFDDNHIITNDY